MKVREHFKSNKLLGHTYKSPLNKINVEIIFKKRQASDLEQLVVYLKQA